VRQMEHPLLCRAWWMPTAVTLASMAEAS
jgi:hypothetical protein